MPAAAVIQRPQALSGFIGRKASVGGLNQCAARSLSSHKVHKVKSYKVNAKYFMNFTNFQLYKLLATCALRAVSSPMSNLGAQLRNRIGY